MTPHEREKARYWADKKLKAELSERYGKTVNKKRVAPFIAASNIELLSKHGPAVLVRKGRS